MTCCEGCEGLTAFEKLTQGWPLEPGDTGYWPVWGARATDIRPGDIVKVNAPVSGVNFYEVAERLPVRESTAYPGQSDLRDICRARFFGTVPACLLGNEYFTVGQLQPIKLYRRGTHNTLADSI